MKSILLVKKLLGLVGMTTGLVNANSACTLDLFLVDSPYL